MYSLASKLGGPDVHEFSFVFLYVDMFPHERNDFCFYSSLICGSLSGCVFELYL